MHVRVKLYCLLQGYTKNIAQISVKVPLQEKRPFSEFLWSVFPRIRTEYGEVLRTSPCSVRMRESTDQENSEYGRFLRSVGIIEKD